MMIRRADSARKKKLTVGFCLLLLAPLAPRTTYATDDFPKSHPYNPSFYLEGNSTKEIGSQRRVEYGGVIEITIVVDKNSTSDVLVTRSDAFFDLESFVVAPGKNQARKTTEIINVGSDVFYEFKATLSLTNTSGTASGTTTFRVVYEGKNVGMLDSWLVSILALTATVYIFRSRNRKR